eukprot:408846-Pyramimonas_sp.AAC.1
MFLTFPSHDVSSSCSSASAGGIQTLSVKRECSKGCEDTECGKWSGVRLAGSAGDAEGNAD